MLVSLIHALAVSVPGSGSQDCSWQCVSLGGLLRGRVEAMDLSVDRDRRAWTIGNVGAAAAEQQKQISLLFRFCSG